jgi:hypothetical protein
MQSALQAELLISRGGRILKHCGYAAMILSLYRFKIRRRRPRCVEPENKNLAPGRGDLHHCDRMFRQLDWEGI